MSRRIPFELPWDTFFDFICEQPNKIKKTDVLVMYIHHHFITTAGFQCLGMGEEVSFR